MTSNTVTLPRTLVNHLLTHAQQAPEDEVCGLIGLSASGVPSLYPIDNVATDTHQLFRMDPRQQIDAMRTMREQGEQLFAIYHSHPHAPSLPSAEDLDQASYPEAIYLIISLNTVGVLEMRAFSLAEGRTEERQLELSDEA